MGRCIISICIYSTNASLTKRWTGRICTYVCIVLSICFVKLVGTIMDNSICFVKLVGTVMDNSICFDKRGDFLWLTAPPTANTGSPLGAASLCQRLFPVDRHHDDHPDPYFLCLRSPCLLRIPEITESSLQRICSQRLHARRPGSRLRR